MEKRRFILDDMVATHVMEFLWVPGTNGTPFGFGNGDPRRMIEIEGFYIGSTPVTQAFWLHIMDQNPAIHVDLCCPVENISWEHITGESGFLDRLNSSDVLPTVSGSDRGMRFRLASESEWEYAARGGPNWRDDFAFSGSNDPDEVAWYGPRWGCIDQAYVVKHGWPAGWYLANEERKRKPCHTEIHPVGEKSPNQLGLYDMSGNVWEWCQDIYSEDIDSIPNNGRPYLESGNERVLRGGCHHNWDLHCRVSKRYAIQQDAHDGCIGLRIVLSST
jgi:formylglycine-generating enzyme